MQQVIYARIRPEIGFTARRRSLVGLCKDVLRIDRIGPSSVRGLPDNKGALAERGLNALDNQSTNILNHAPPYIRSTTLYIILRSDHE